jgi:hypothetical protein
MFVMLETRYSKACFCYFYTPSFEIEQKTENLEERTLYVGPTGKKNIMGGR